MIDLITCSAKDLALYIKEHRFPHSASEAASFLQEAVSTFSSTVPSPTQSSILKATATPFTTAHDNDMNIKRYIEQNLGDPQTHIPDQFVSCISPRGKYQFSFHKNGMILLKQTSNGSQRIIIKYKNIQHMIQFPKSDDCRQKKKMIQKLGLLVFHNPVSLMVGEDTIFPSNGSKPKSFSQICLPWPLEDNAEIELQKASKIYSIKWTQCFNGPQNVFFQSDQDKFPFVSCYHGVNTGSLYPLQSGLLFFKPPFFLPREKIHSIGCGRGGSSSTRYVDMNIVCEEDIKNDDESVETYEVQFTNVVREELGPLNDYIQKLVTMDDSSNGEEINDESDEDQEEDPQSSPDENEDKNSKNKEEQQASRKRRIPKRAAATESRQATKYQMANVEDDDSESDEEEYQMRKRNNDSDDDDDDDDDLQDYVDYKEDIDSEGDVSDEEDSNNDTDTDGTISDNEESEQKKRKKRKI